ncbi:UDP-N-acetylmuramoyl-tripeptide--D-alanyl-D-alanine ligase [Flavobacterium litorale]|uniref:UDP-N-acetylmuramoyl-tripeptide--D-alanyl-D-alanine ligase n=1 Tax=Flavobacterium litorale TaxID=2856519 RepID=A0ABX8VBW8_9FLAO|nr:UDP-N-acetylmuramoyl-tripeptide--D-alanyl-D-alanine ligase [Flavobacterium litorale]QYJ68526.1 UDP-N-acetylmuramoyl-tripeptide--D-alanyl-D-alanine ligase [Flavobacterium litorale]
MDIAELYSYFKQCASVATDTRKIEKDTLFIALKGANFNANTFATEALAKGAKYAVVDEPEYQTDERILLVDNTLTTLQKLANFHRKTLGLPIIALTGSNGKTTTKELINAVLSTQYTTTATVGNLNNHIGVPLTLLSFTEQTEIGIVEMGANHQKEIEFLCSIAEPNFGYITNFGKAHLEGFGGYEGVIKGKSELYTYLKDTVKTVFVNLDDVIQKEKTATISRFTFAVNNYNCDVNIEYVTANPMVEVTYKGTKIKTNLIGIYNATNISAAIAIGTYFKINEANIKNALENYVPNNNRSQIIQKDNTRIILDAYNANPSSMRAAITNLEQLDGKNKIAILGDMFELGRESEVEHKKIIDVALNTNYITFYFIGKSFFENKIEAEHIYFFESFENFSYYFKNVDTQNNTLLIKGSRGMALERILDSL